MSSPEVIPHAEALAMMFYVNGTLAPEEARAVAQHLAGCAACREERARCERLRDGVKGAVETLPGPPPELLARVRARIAESRPVPARSHSPSRRPRWLAPRFALAAGLALAAQVGLLAAIGTLAYRSGERAATTLSGPSESLGATGPRLRLAFADAATAAQIRELLQPLGARVVDGPSAAGFWVVELRKDGDAAAAVTHFEASPLVRFAERVE